MRDLTQGSLTGHILSMSAFMAVGLIVQTLYFLVDLYFVAGLGAAATAGVSAAGNASFLIMAASNIIAVGAMSLIAHAAGRKDSADASTVSAQALGLSLCAAAATIVLGYPFAGPLVGIIAADAETRDLGALYLNGFLPSLACMFPTAALGASLRGAGVVQQTMWVQSGTLLLNVLLAPILIRGWLTGMPLGVFGAGLASSIAVALGLVALWFIFPRAQNFIRFDSRALKPRFETWRRITAIGFPSALEFLLMFVSTAIIYWVIRPYGADAQAGFGVGARVMQSVFLPAMAVSFAAAPIAGQNFGARQYDRVRMTFRDAALIGAAIMLALSVLCHWRPDLLVAAFSSDARVQAAAVEYVVIASWNFVAIGVVFACSGMFQALGDTRPSILTSGVRLLTFAAPALWLSGQPNTVVADFWRLGVASVWIQAALSLYLLHRMFRAKLPRAAPA